MPVKQTVRLYKRDCRQSVASNGIEKVDRVLDVRSTLRGVAHDRGRVRFEVAMLQ